MKNIILLVLICNLISVSGCTSKVAPLWRVKNGIAVRYVTATGPNEVALLAGEGLVLVEATTGKTKRTIPLPDKPFTVISCSATKCVAGGGNEHLTGELIMIDLESGAIRYPATEIHFAHVYGVTVLSEQRFATAHVDETAIAWNAQTLTPVRQLETRGDLETWAIDGESDNVFVGNDSGALISWNIKSGKVSARKQFQNPIVIVAVNGQTIVAVSRYSLFVLDRNLVLKHEFHLKDAGVISCQASIDNTILCGLRNGAMLIVDGYTVKQQDAVVGAKAKSFAIAGDVAVTVENDGSISGWKLNSPPNTN